MNPGRYWKLFLFTIAILFLFSCVNRNQIASTSPIPRETRQLILVLTDSATANQGRLYRFERETDGQSWRAIGQPIPVALGRNGLAWGRGLHPQPQAGLPVKREGDGKSPAGVFTLSAVFGQIHTEEMKGLNMPYIYLKEGVECVDDSASLYYNRMVDRDTVSQADWHSSEKMWHPGIWYRLGVVVDHNRHPVKKGAGSCIFLHNWAEPGETTSGCTAMEPTHLKTIAFWLKADQPPVLVQLTREWYRAHRNDWELPEIPNPDNR